MYKFVFLLFYFLSIFLLTACNQTPNAVESPQIMSVDTPKLAVPIDLQSDEHIQPKSPLPLDSTDINHLIRIGDNWWENLGVKHSNIEPNCLHPKSVKGHRAFFALLGREFEPYHMAFLIESHYRGDVLYRISTEMCWFPQYILNAGFNQVMAGDPRVNIDSVVQTVELNTIYIDMMLDKGFIELEYAQDTFSALPKVVWKKNIDPVDLQDAVPHFRFVHETSLLFEDALSDHRNFIRASLPGSAVSSITGGAHAVSRYVDGKIKGFSYAGQREDLLRVYDVLAVTREFAAMKY